MLLLWQRHQVKRLHPEHLLHPGPVIHHPGGGRNLRSRPEYNTMRKVLHHSHLGVSMESFGVKSSLDSFGNTAARPGPRQFPSKAWNTVPSTQSCRLICFRQRIKNDLLVAISDGSLNVLPVETCDLARVPPAFEERLELARLPALDNPRHAGLGLQLLGLDEPLQRTKVKYIFSSEIQSCEPVHSSWPPCARRCWLASQSRPRSRSCRCRSGRSRRSEDLPAPAAPP